MDEKDFAQIEKLFTKLSEDFSGKLDAQSKDFHRWIGVQGDVFQHSLDLVVDGIQMISEKVDRVETSLNAVDEKLSKRIDTVQATLTKKVDAVAADVSAHRADTEAHHGMYRVKEGDESFSE